MTSQITAIITILVILIVNAAFERWPQLQPPPHEGWPVILAAVLERTPFWLVFGVTFLTIVSGFLYIRRYKDLLRTEFSMLRMTKMGE